MRSTKTRDAVFFICAIVFGAGLGCNGGNGGQNNEQCESRCVEDYHGELGTCEEKTTNCMASCKSVNDNDCMWDCEGFQSECSGDLILCIADCPCTEDHMACFRDCDTEDRDCMMDCTELYQECAGANSPYTCTTLCSAQNYGCLFDCEDEQSSIPEYINCREDCHATLSNCVGDCI